MSNDERFLMLDVDGVLTALHGGVRNIGALLGQRFAMYEAVPGLCFAVSQTASARYAEPNLHLAKFARISTGVIAPFFGSAVFFGGIDRDGEDFLLRPLPPGQEQSLRRSVESSRTWLTGHPDRARRGAQLAEGIRTRHARQQAPRT